MSEPLSPHRRKFARALEHLQDIHDAVDRFKTDNPGIARRDTDSEPNPRIWRIRGYLTKEPDRDMEVLVGDFIHNLRASLDHLAAALKPDRGKSKTVFPTVGEDPWRRKANTRRYVDRNPWVRKGFLRNIEGMHPTAQAYIKRLQPYNEAYDSNTHMLSILNTLDNADKHYELMDIRTGFTNAHLTITHPDFVFGLAGDAGPDVVVSGGILGDFRIWPRDLKAITPDQRVVDAILSHMTRPDAQVDMEFTCTPEIAVRTGAGAMGRIPQDLDRLVSDLDGYVLQALEQYILR
jgi:hypothetical protein